MFFNYIKTSLRALLNNKLYSLINLTGLAVGMTVSILILLFVYHEVNYDRFHTKADRIFRMLGKVNWGGQEMQMIQMSAQFGPTLKAGNADIESYVRIRDAGRIIIQNDPAHTFFENRFLFVDSTFLRVFSFSLASGPSTALGEPGNVFITKAMAIKYFGHTDVIGQTLSFKREYSMKVAGIIEPAPSNSSIQFDFVASFSSLGQIASEKNQYEHTQVSLGAYTTYLLLRNTSDEEKIETAIPALAKTSVDETYVLEPLTSIHMGNNFGNTSNSRNIYIFLFVALLILMLALVNYMNLTTARATTRAKEVGIRKIIGAGRMSLSMQFYIESAMLTLGAFMLALILVELFIPVMLNTLQQPLDHSFFTSPLFITVLTALLITCVFLSGSYPAIVLSRFQPAEILKGKASGTGEGAWIRKSFTTFQFTVSIGLIVCTLVVNSQLDFLRNQKLGLNKEQVMVVELSEEASSGYAGLKNDLRELSGIQNVAASSIPLYTGGHSMFFTKTPGTQENVAINVITIDESFPETIGFTWAQKPKQKLKNRMLLINESAIHKLKLDKDPVGTKLSLGNSDEEVTGVVTDFNYTSLEHKIEGLVMSVASDTARLMAAYGASIYIRLDPASNVVDKIAAIKTIFAKYQPGTPFGFYFLDDAFNKLYQSEDRLASLFEVFTVIGIGIAALGLFGLVTFAIERRVKEIGIRKVLGASGFQIVRLFSGEFVWLFLISLAIAAPVSWWAMEQWLTKFSYRISITIWMVACAGVITLFIACITIAIKTWRTAQANPVDSLKNE